MPFGRLGHPPRRFAFWGWAVALAWLAVSSPAAAAKKQHIVTTLYMWFPAPHTDVPGLNSPKTWVYDPPFEDGTENVSYWVRNLRDLAKAGFTGAFLVASAPDAPGVAEQNLRRYKIIVRALERLQRRGLTFKVGLLVAVGSAAHSRAYEDLVRPFFQTIPPEFWLGQRVTPAGRVARRPMIYFWTTDADRSTFTAAMAAVPDQFLADFGKRPFLAFELEPYRQLLQPALAQAVIQWNAPIGGHVMTDIRGYRVSSLGVGNNEQLIRPWRCHGNNPDEPIVNYRPRGDAADPAAFIRAEFREVPPDIDLLFIQDANELNEGTTFLRAKNFPAADNPVFNYCAPNYKLRDPIETVWNAYAAADNGRYLPVDYYLSVVRELIRSRWPQNLPGSAAVQAAEPGAHE